MTGADFKIAGRPGFSLVEICIVVLLLVLGLLLASFYWREANQNAIILENRTMVEQKFQQLLLKLKQDLRSAKKVEGRQDFLLIERMQFMPENNELKIATITWLVENSNTVIRLAENGSETRMNFAEASQQLRVALGFSLPQKGIVKVKFSAFNAKTEAMIDDRSEQIAYATDAEEVEP